MKTTGSPSGAVESRQQVTSQHTFSGFSHKTETLLTTPRWARVIWSPDDAWFCVDDEYDPDNNRLHVYHAYHDGTTELIWSTFEAAPDTYWKVLGWRMEKGMIRIEAHYAKDYNRPSKGWITQSYLIPIFLPNRRGQGADDFEALPGIGELTNDVSRADCALNLLGLHIL